MHEAGVTVGAATAGLAVHIRPARSDDRPRVESLLAAAGLPVEGAADQFEHGFAVAESGGELIGAAGVETYGPHGLLRSLVVAPDTRGRRVGRALVADRVEWSRAHGVRTLYLLTTTAAPFFTHLGFGEVTRERVPGAVQRSSEFSELCPSTATVMALQLAQPESSCCGGEVTALSAKRALKVAGSSCCGGGRALPEATAAIAAEDDQALKALVRERYGAAATRAASGATSSCCGASADEVWDPITADLYDDAEKQGLPVAAVLASLGCGNPTALAELHDGETVLDLGSGGGIDVLLSARRVGARGKAYGLDMTDEMLALARENQQRAGAQNVEFLKGDIEAIPLPDASVDVIISNCVINLAADKSKVLREAFRVLRPGGRFAVSDIVARRDVPPAVRRSMELWMGCVAGALEENEYARLLASAGFEQVALEPTRVYQADDARYFLEGAGIASPDTLSAMDGAFMSAFIRARKPDAG